jgi:hypothetical protein
VEVVIHCTAATYVRVGSSVDLYSHVTSLLSMTSDGHQGIADLGRYNSQDGIFMCVKVTLHCDLIEMTKSVMEL